MTEENKIYQKWTQYTMLLAAVLCVLIFIGEFIACLYMYFQASDAFNVNNFLIQKMFGPSLYNFIVLIIGYIFMQSSAFDDKKKRFIPIITIAIIDCGFMAFHSKFPVCIMSLMYPILLSVVYTDRKMTKVVVTIDVLIIICSMILMLYTNNSITYDYLVSLLISTGFLVGLVFLALLMTKVGFQKRSLLLKSIEEKDLYYKKASIDELTESYNHASYVKKIQESINKDLNIILAIIDIDHFKRVNDTYGHDSGNIVLKRMGKILNKENCDDIFVCRYGGEEFVLLFFNHTAKQAEKKIEKLKEKISDISFKELNGEHITFSCGLAKEIEYDTPTELFNRADKALYYAKENGRNKIVTYKK